KNKAIWALGLRNPFTFAFSRSGAMQINDVGELTWEEINSGTAGANYGWPATDGPTSDSRFRSPTYAYRHQNNGCAIGGATFYTPDTIQFPPEYYNSYFFSDLCGGWIRRLDPTNNNVVTFASNISMPVDLQVGPDGALYYLVRGPQSDTGSVYRVA